MTVHLHRANEGVFVGGHRHRLNKNKKGRREDLDTDRTWAFDCVPACEQRVLSSVEHSATHSGGVPFTQDEEHSRQDQESAAQMEVARMSHALAGVVRERMTTDAEPKVPAKAKS